MILRAASAAAVLREVKHELALIAIGWRCWFRSWASNAIRFAADPRYPDWPCAQAKVPEISLAAVWDGPPPRRGKEFEMEGRCQGKCPGAAKLAARRTPLDQAEKMVTEFLREAASKKSESGKLLFAALFDTLNAQRSSVMNGLERVTRKQREAAEQGSAVPTPWRCRRLQDASPYPDQPKIDELGNQLVWETRIFEVTAGGWIKFVCEVPTAIDFQRLFALGRVIQQEME